jgi:hypothetical protein
MDRAAGAVTPVGPLDTGTLTGRFVALEPLEERHHEGLIRGGGRPRRHHRCGPAGHIRRHLGAGAGPLGDRLTVGQAIRFQKQWLIAIAPRVAPSGIRRLAEATPNDPYTELFGHTMPVAKLFARR